MTQLTYEVQSTWKEIQAFLPTRLHFTEDHKPTEETWENRGHRLHIDRWRNPNAKARVILHHGVGTNGREMSMILGVPLHTAGFEVVAIDMPGYGVTQNAPGITYKYDDWVDIACDLLDKESADGLPVLLYGLSAGGMLAFQVAGKMKKEGRTTPIGIVSMCFIDVRQQWVLDATANNLFMSHVGTRSAGLLNRLGLGWVSMPFKMIAKMTALVNDDAALRICLRDRSSAGAWVSMRFMATYQHYQPTMDWEEFDVCPILLTQPAADPWTPLSLSQPFLDRAKGTQVSIVELGNAGHYPLEDPGLQQLADAMIRFLNERIEGAPKP
ncbi:lysophospholipase-like protein [Thozetella sp. PMI_491]|nr:lysophospholipase-like protein [Thozetella sp. PMI_491]